MRPFGAPEIVRVPLEELVLQVGAREAILSARCLHVGRAALADLSLFRPGDQLCRLSAAPLSPPHRVHTQSCCSPQNENYKPMLTQRVTQTSPLYFPCTDPPHGAGHCLLFPRARAAAAAPEVRGCCSCYTA